MQLTAAWDGVDLAVLRDPLARLDDHQLAQVDHIAGLPVPALPPASPEFFAQAMRMLALLPRRGDDDTTGALRLALYERHFASCSEKALQFLVDQATLTCRFFPSPMECKAILDRYQRRDRPARAHRLAAQLARRERQTRYDDLFRRFRIGAVTQEEVDTLPERWKAHAVTQGHIRDDHTLRPVRAPETPDG